MPISPYIDVILPLPLAGSFTYALPMAMGEQVSVGSRVIVPFGRKKFYTGIVQGFSPAAPKEYEVKEALCVLDSHPVVRHPQLKLWEWMSDYYLCSIGDVYKAAVPTGLKIESETRFEANPDFDAEDASTLPERELLIWQLLQTKGKLEAKEIEKETGFRSVPTLMQRLVERGAAIVSETIVDKYRPKREKYARIAFARADEEALRAAFAAVKGAKKQEMLLMTLLQLSGFTRAGVPVAEVTQQELLDKAQATTTILKALVDKGLVERYTKEVSRFAASQAAVSPLPALSDAQSEALRQIHSSFKDKQTVLLHGVTSSGKTEIYAHLIDYVLSQGMQALYLVPEIALTTQLTARLRAIFGDRLLIYHSKFTDNERVEIWRRLLRGNEPCVVVGARSAIFLPFAKLGLCIVDEEHDQSYKQFDPAPRYNARDCAIMLAHMHGGKTLLGSATPAVETYYKALSGKYGLVSLLERYKGATQPEIEIVDMAKAAKKKAIDASFADTTIAAVRQAVRDGQQAIVFHNRRGFAPMARCGKCQYVPKCQYCDVSLTYHKRANSLVCHYCGASYPLPETCPVCGEAAIDVVGYGTERIEDEVDRIFPEAKSLRMDLDTTRNKNSYENLIDQFSQRKADILVGTQMVTKGLDFGGVSVVAVVNADNIINFPDFRSAERAFCILEQVSGRAGRRDIPGHVLIQTRTPEHPVIQHVQAHDYLAFYTAEIEERRVFSYPPFTRLIYIRLKHRDERELDEIASLYADRLRQLFGNRVQGPAKPPVARVQSLFIRQIMLKVELNASMPKVKQILRDLYAHLRSTTPTLRSLILQYDVDPY